MRFQCSTSFIFNILNVYRNKGKELSVIKLSTIYRCTFVDFVSGTLASTRSVEDCATVLQRYREAFSALVVEVLKKLQFRCNSTALEEMDDETIGKQNHCNTCLVSHSAI